MTNPTFMRSALIAAAAGAILIPSTALALAEPVPGPAPVQAPAPAAAAGDQKPAAEATPTGARQTPATVTVTATVAPGQCKPAGAPTTQVTDTAAAVTTRPGAPVAVSAAPTSAKPSASSRFDPYTCAPVPAVATTSATTTTSAPVPTIAPVVPSGPETTFTTTLAPYPGAGSIGRPSTGGSSGSNGDSSALTEPTAQPTITAAPR